jgi:hypothetical protein
MLLITCFVTNKRSSEYDQQSSVFFTVELEATLRYFDYDLKEQFCCELLFLSNK